jgi:hypothetical protein
LPSISWSTSQSSCRWVLIFHTSTLPSSSVWKSLVVTCQTAGLCNPLEHFGDLSVWCIEQCFY